LQELLDSNKDQFIEWLNRQWCIEFDLIRPDITIEGSPERTLARTVFQVKNGQRFLLEKFAKGRSPIRQQVAEAIEYLNQNGLREAPAYRKTDEGEFLPCFNGACYQLSRFLPGTGIKRPDYLASPTIGKNFAAFLKNLSRASINIEKLIHSAPFSIKAYIYKLFEEMKVHDPSMVERFLPFLVFLEKTFMPFHDKLPLSFCHGDLHPLNVIWNQEEILAVIDWEFTGIKPDIYDAANLVGCAGIENPEGLGMPMVMTFLKELRRTGLFSNAGWRFFPEYVLALRFAWLSEWLRKKDTEMLAMEEMFMRILVDNIDLLRHGWGLNNPDR
jgi:homoserine kinase type II